MKTKRMKKIDEQQDEIKAKNESNTKNTIFFIWISSFIFPKLKQQTIR